jgi:DNA-binding winged helix-turn-helix (wHTH) protein
VYLFDGFQLDVTRRKLISSGGLVQPLHSRAMEALLLLVANAGELVEKRRLMQTVWPDSVVEDNNLNQCVLAIRKALGETAGSNRYIMTVPGRGYRFVSPVRALVQESGIEAALPPPRQRSIQSPWARVVLALGVLLLGVLLLRFVRIPVGEREAVTASGSLEQASPAIVLQLHELPGANGAAPAANATALLSRCLAAHPDLKLRVRVQLVAQSGAPVWVGQYIAGARDLLALQPGEAAGAAGCDSPTIVVQPDDRRTARP